MLNYRFLMLIALCLVVVGCDGIARGCYDNTKGLRVERNPDDVKPIAFTNPYELSEQELETEIAKVYTRAANMDKIHPANLDTHHDLESNLLVLKLFILLDAKGSHFNYHDALITE